MAKGRKYLLLLVFIFVVLLPVNGGAAGNKGTVIIAEWGGSLGDALRKAYYIPFEEKTGIKVIQASGPDPVKLRAMVESGNVEWDVVEHSMMEIIRFGPIGLLEKIDYSVFNQKFLDDIDDIYQNEYGFGGFVWSQILAYDKDVFGNNGPKNWADFWNIKKFPGPRTLESGSGGDPPPFEYALMADGVSINSVYPIDMDRAFAKLKEIAPHIPKWWTGGAQPGQMLIDGEVVMAQAFSGRIANLIKKGANLGMVYNQGLVSVDYWVVPKGAPNKDNAMKLLAFMADPKQQAEFAKSIPYGPVSSKAYDYIDEKTAKMLPTHPDNINKQLWLNHEYWGPKRPEALEKWTNWSMSLE